ncbi:MAG: 30S ribosomal protein S6 [Acidobacteria bacterium]|nr:30S ribosomal protein S6 [Acidobacteriota bacterium]
MAREYEIMLILQADQPEEEREKFIQQVGEWVTGAGGTVAKVDPIGSRRLAYRIGQNSDGFYVLFHLQGEGDFTKQVERRLKVADPVMKFLTVRIDLELKKIEKLKKLREKREARKKTKARPAPAAEAV